MSNCGPRLHKPVGATGREVGRSGQNGNRALYHGVDHQVRVQSKVANFTLGNGVERSLRRPQIYKVLLATTRPEASVGSKLSQPVELALPLPPVEATNRRVGDDQLPQRGEQPAPLRMHVDEHEDQLP